MNSDYFAIGKKWLLILLCLFVAGGAAKAALDHKHYKETHPNIEMVQMKQGEIQTPLSAFYQTKSVGITVRERVYRRDRIILAGEVTNVGNKPIRAISFIVKAYKGDQVVGRGMAEMEYTSSPLRKNQGESYMVIFLEKDFYPRDSLRYHDFDKIDITSVEIK